MPKTTATTSTSLSSPNNKPKMKTPAEEVQDKAAIGHRKSATLEHKENDNGGKEAEKVPNNPHEVVDYREGQKQCHV